MRDRLADDYRTALDAYVRSPDEAGRVRAYELGHRAVEVGLGLLDLMAIHRQAVAEQAAGDPPGAWAVDAVEFLTESLSTFEMAQRGYHEARERAAVAHDLAVTLQRSLLPADLPVPDALDVAVRYLPAGGQAEVGGDWYDVVPLDGGRVGLVVGDVMGHGIRQAAVMGQVRMGLRAYLLEGHPIDDVIRRTDVLLHSLGGVQTATLVLVVVDPAGPTVEIANAGHPPPVVIDGAGAARLDAGGHGRLLGLAMGGDWPVRGPVPFEPGDRLLLYTDGLLERHERAGHDGFDRLHGAVDGFTGTPDQLCDRVTDVMVDGEPGDDVCLLAARLVEGGPAG